MKRLLAASLSLVFLAPTPAFANDNITVFGQEKPGPNVSKPTEGTPPPNPPVGGPPPCRPPTLAYDSGSYTLTYRAPGGPSVSGKLPPGSPSAEALAAELGGWNAYALNLPETDWHEELVSDLVGGTWTQATHMVYDPGCEDLPKRGLDFHYSMPPRDSDRVIDSTPPDYANGWCTTRMRAEISGPYTRAFEPWPGVEFRDGNQIANAGPDGWYVTAYGNQRNLWREDCLGKQRRDYVWEEPISERGRYTGQYEAEGDRIAVVWFPSNPAKWGWTGNAGKRHRTVLESDKVYDNEGVYRTINCENNIDNPSTKVEPDPGAPLDRERAAWPDGNQFYYTESYADCTGQRTNTDGDVPPSEEDPDGTGGTPDTIPGTKNSSLPQIGIRCEADRQYPKYTLADGTERTNGSDIVQVRADNKVTKIDWLPDNPVGVEITGGNVVGDISWRSRFTLSPTLGENSPSLLTGDVNDPEQPYGTVAHKDIDRENTNPTSTWFDLDRWVDEDGKRVSVSADRQEAPVAGFGVRFADSSKVDYTKSEDGKPPVGRHWRTTPEWEATFKVNTRVLQNDSFSYTNGLIKGGYGSYSDDSSVNGNGSYRTQEVQLTYVCLGRNSRLQAQRVSTVPTE